MFKTNGDYIIDKYTVTDVETKHNIVIVYTAEGHVFRFWKTWWDAKQKQ